MRALLVAMLLSPACRTPSGGAPAEVPAVLVNPGAQGRAALAAAVSAALGGVPVTLADDALTRESLLIVEPAHLEGRETRRPERFRLVKSGADCVLVHERTGKRQALPSAECAPAR